MALMKFYINSQKKMIILAIISFLGFSFIFTPSTKKLNLISTENVYYYNQLLINKDSVILEKDSLIDSLRFELIMLNNCENRFKKCQAEVFHLNAIIRSLKDTSKTRSNHW